MKKKRQIEVGDFVLYDGRYYVVIQIFHSETAVRYVIEDLVTKAVRDTTKDVELVDEKDFNSIARMQVVYNNSIWTVENIEAFDSLSGKRACIKRNNVSILVDRDELRVFNPVLDAHLIDQNKEKKAKMHPIITTGSFVVDNYSFTSYYVVMSDDGLNCVLESLTNGHTFATRKENVEYIAEQDIKLLPGMRIIYDGKVGTFLCNLNVNNKICIEESPKFLGLDEYEIFNPYFHDYEEIDGVKILKLKDFIDKHSEGGMEFYPIYHPSSNIENLIPSPKENIEKNDFESNNNEEESETHLSYQQEVFEYKAGYSDEIDKRNLLLNSLAKLQTYLDQLEPKFKYNNEYFCKGVSEVLFSNVAINFINKIIIRKYEQDVLLKLIFNGYSTQISFTISTRKDLDNYVVKLLVFDNFKCKESFTGDLNSAFKYFANFLYSQGLNKSLFDKPEKDDFVENMDSFVSEIAQSFADKVKGSLDDTFESISQGLKQSEGKLMVQELYWPFIEQMARVMTINKEKYPPKNYLKPMDKEELLAAAQRHQLSMWLGEEIDPTDGQPHAVKVATNMMMYYCQLKLYPDA